MSRTSSVFLPPQVLVVTLGDRASRRCLGLDELMGGPRDGVSVHPTLHPRGGGVSQLYQCLGGNPSPPHLLPWSGGWGRAHQPPSSSPPCSQRLNPSPACPERTPNPHTHRPSAHRMPTGKADTRRREERPGLALPPWGELACRLRGSVVKGSNLGDPRPRAPVLRQEGSDQEAGVLSGRWLWGPVICLCCLVPAAPTAPLQ